MRYFNLTDGVRSSRVEILDEAARTCSVPFRARPADPGRGVAFQHMDRYFGGINVTQTALDNFHGFRSANVARRDPMPRLILTVSSGPYAIEQNGRMDRQRSGSMVPYWSRDALRLRADEPTQARSITVTMEELGMPYLFLRDVMVRNIGRSPLGPLVDKYLTELAGLPELSEAQAAALAHPTVDLLRALLTTAGGDEFLSRQPLSQTMGMRIMLYLRTHAGDPELSADKLAAHFGISKRYLYAVLARMNVTLGEWIRTERLSRAARALVNPANALVSVAAIARMSGYPDHSSFSRAFKQQYGCTPSEWRLRTDTDRMIRQTRITLPEIAEISSETRH
ncbi:helix-turn-helix transcriptional regulator [Plantactinospora soyae]|uniref:AraC-like DNA-binding protein n=1 Tax=Plantactinospora soyae TaxID=1544732 RepID=A0A927QZM0_9ACTN|nr:helix-turn-helix transcriptional regulator [Plantactinospora soyae]MBE1490560.1 AraC-like DNA-binding protein [Plantactinospora soyae]